MFGFAPKFCIISNKLRKNSADYWGGLIWLQGETNQMFINQDVTTCAGNTVIEFTVTPTEFGISIYSGNKMVGANYQLNKSGEKYNYIALG